MNFKYKLPAGYIIKEVSNEELDKLWVKPGKRMFNDYSLFPDKKLLFSKK